MQTFPLKPKSSPLHVFTIAVAFSLFAYCTLNLTIFSVESYSKMTSNPDSSADMVPLIVKISNVEETTPPNAEYPQINLKVTIINTSPDKSVKFLRWATPFDVKAVTMGIFKFKNLKTGEFAPCLDMKVGRKMPESGVFDDADVVTVEVGKEIERITEVGAPKVALESGEKYEVVAKGRWMYVSVGETDRLTSGEDESISGEFESEGLKFELRK